MTTINPVILCGGSGTRLWPLSRSGFPKQFLVISGTDSLFQQAISRATALTTAHTPVGKTLIVTNEEHRFLVEAQLRDMNASEFIIILEPDRRNTAPALTLAAFQAVEESEDPMLIVSPADHIIKDSQAFTNSVHKAICTAMDGAIVTLGITPDRPETGFGYIKRQGGPGPNGEFDVERFEEKPTTSTAERFLKSGEYDWNSGIFVMKAHSWLSALEAIRPDILKTSGKAWSDRKQDKIFVRPSPISFKDIPSESIDYAVMEKCPKSTFPLKVIPMDAGWSDLGAWEAVWEVGEQDVNGNVVHGDTFLADTNNALVHATSRFVGVADLDDIVVIESPDVVLVAKKSQSEGVKKIVSELGTLNREERNLHRKVHRPWGWYDCIEAADRFKVKRIRVNPGERLSLQKHLHRSEHWIVVKGTAEVTRGDQVTILSENQSAYIPLGEIHRLANVGSIPLEIIEVQSGSYLGEDDIVRLEDNYGRLSSEREGIEQ
jgi:mannose-1-phosphate guanylyltransferase / mannose-6-phosphate isomerase